MSQGFKVTKSWLVGEFAQGALVATVLEKVNSTLPEGSKLSEMKFKAGLKQLGINLRTKPRPTSVMFVDDTVEADTNVISQSVEAQPVQAEPVANQEVVSENVVDEATV